MVDDWITRVVVSRRGRITGRTFDKSKLYFWRREGKSRIRVSWRFWAIQTRSSAELRSWKNAKGFGATVVAFPVQVDGTEQDLG